MIRRKPGVCSHGKLVEYKYVPGDFKVTDEMKEAFDWDGALMIRGLFSKEEIDKINHQIEVNPEISKRAMKQPDGRGRNSKLSLWSHPGNDVSGMVARVEKVAGTCQELLGGEEIYHYHSKLMMKEARTGGCHLWHQDYGYWYQNGLLRPDCMTAYIAVDKCVKENGCLEVVLGTHRCGRINHDLIAGQTVANQERVDELLKAFPHLYVEMEPGDGLFFHSNLLHTANKNDSDMRRYSFLIAYNRRDNNPVYEHHHPQYTPLDIVSNDALLTCTNYMDLSGKEFMKGSDDAKTTRMESCEDK